MQKVELKWATSQKKKKLSGLYLINNWDKPTQKKKKGINGVYQKKKLG